MYPSFFFGLGLADELVDAHGAHHGDALGPTAARDLLGRPQALPAAHPLLADLRQLLRIPVGVVAPLVAVAPELAADDRFVAP